MITEEQTLDEQTPCAACGNTTPAGPGYPSGTVECTTCGQTLCSSPCFSLQHGPAPDLPRRRPLLGGAA